MESLRLLLLEDSPLDAKLALTTLEAGGLPCESLRVETEADFVAALRQQSFSLILADYSLPDFDGITALRLAQELCPDIPFIFLSGALGEELAIDTLKSGATDYVLKQRMQRLVPAVRRALREADDRQARKRAEEELALLLRREQAARAEAEAANQAKDVFLATVSHELRTPLAAMLGYVRLLRTGRLNAQQTTEALEALNRNVQAQAQLVNDLLDISRIISGKFNLEVNPVDPLAAIEAALDVVRPAAEAKAISLEARLEPVNGLIYGDLVRLQQVFWNLLSNAVKFTPPGGRVEIRLQRSGSQLEVSVTDNGQGIAPEFLPLVFDPFRQADGSANRKQEGLGLGLAIVRHLVEMHGGQVQANSAGLGQGASFTVWLPLLEAKQAVSEASELSDFAEETNEDFPALKGINILVVDDTPDVREVLSVLLGQQGAEVKTASSAAEAIRIFEQWRPDVLISDIGLPGEDGYSLIAKIRALAPERGGRVPALALTAYAQAQDRDRALAAGFQLHIPKPVDPAELAQAIASLTSQSSYVVSSG